jgi:hypothetical protein
MSNQMNSQTPHRFRIKLLLAACMTVGFSVQGSVSAIAQTSIAQKLPGAGTVKPMPIPIGKPIDIGTPITKPAGASTCCPPMDTQVFGTFFKRIDPGNITSPYELKFDPMGLGLGTQYTAMMNAHQSYYTLLNYLSSGQITSLVIGVYLNDGGTGDNPVASSAAPLAQAFISFSNSGINQPAPNSFFTPALQPNRWYGINQYTYTNIGFDKPQQAGFAQSCNKGIKTWVRWQVINGRLMRQTINDGKLESVDLKAVSTK